MVKFDVIEKLVGTLFEESEVKTWTIYHEKSSKDIIVKLRFVSHGDTPAPEDGSQTTYTKKSASQVQRDSDRAKSRKKRKISYGSSPEFERKSDVKEIQFDDFIDSPEHVVCVRSVDRAEHECKIQTPATLHIDHNKHETPNVGVLTGAVLHPPKVKIPVVIPDATQILRALPSTEHMCEKSIKEMDDMRMETECKNDCDKTQNCPCYAKRVLDRKIDRFLKSQVLAAKSASYFPT